MSASLNERLLANFLDGTLASAIEQLAQDADSPVVRSCLYEAADKLRAGASFYEALTDIRNRILCPVGPSPTLDDVQEIASTALAKVGE